MRKVLEHDLALIFPLALGIMLRFMPMLVARFPINDGGMFFVMTQQIIDSELELPNVILYNGLQLPFAYPPLGFYIVAIVQIIFRLDLLVLFQWVPAIFASISLPVFYLFAYVISESRVKARLSLLVFASLISGYYTLVAGGGITRGVGLIMALLTLHRYLIFEKARHKKDLFIGGILLGLTFLSHLEMSVFVVVGLFWLTFIRTRKWKVLFQVILIGIVVSSPWWVLILIKHGIDPFLAAWSSNLVVQNGWMELALLNFTHESGITLWAIVGVMGFVYLLNKKEYLLPVWVVLLYFLLKRGAETPATVIWAIISGEVLFEGLKSMFNKRVNFLVLGVTVFWLLMYLTTQIINQNGFTKAWMEPVSQQDLKAVEWVNEFTLPEEKFLIFSETPNGWSTDAISEWFPALTGRKSILTIQGTEWKIGLPLEIFRKRLTVYQCFEKIECVNFLSPEKLGMNYDYIYITPHENCPSESCPLYGNYEYYPISTYEKVYQKEGVVILKRLY